MPTGKKLGLSWGNNVLSIAEFNGNLPLKIIRIPFNPSSAIDSNSPLAHSEDVKLSNAIHQSLKSNGISLTDAYLAVPSKDVVIRSFVIPFLKSNEIKSVVEFEIKKYIPFQLKDLFYRFHAVLFVDDKAKRMRVHFVAIRKEILERYKAILKQAGINIVFSEPAPMCIARLLLFKKQIRSDQKIAIVHTDFNDSRILVVDHGIVQFVRDFQLQNPALNSPVMDPEMLKKKLFNEIKISLDFYSRQFKGDKIQEVMTLSFDPQQDLNSALQQDIEMPVKKIDPQVLMNQTGTLDAGVISAFGVTLDIPAKTVDFNLSADPGVSASSQFQNKVSSEYFPALKIGVVCAVLIGVVFFVSSLNVTQVKKRYESLYEAQGPFVDMTLEDIQKRMSDNQEKLQAYKAFFKKSEMANIFSRIPQLLSEGIWLTELTVQEIGGDSLQQGAPRADNASNAFSLPQGLSIELSGYAYTEDSNQQFKMVYALVNVLKNDEKLKKYFNNVSLTGIQSEPRDQFTVTSFKISCK